MFAERGELFRDTSAKEATLRVDKAAMRDVVAGQVAALAQLDLASIEQLPPVTEVVSSLNNATVTQYHALMSEADTWWSSKPFADEGWECSQRSRSMVSFSRATARSARWPSPRSGTLRSPSDAVPDWLARHHDRIAVPARTARALHRSSAIPASPRSETRTERRPTVLSPIERER